MSDNSAFIKFFVPVSFLFWWCMSYLGALGIEYRMDPLAFDTANVQALELLEKQKFYYGYSVIVPMIYFPGNLLKALSGGYWQSLLLDGLTWFFFIWWSVLVAILVLAWHVFKNGKLQSLLWLNFFLALPVVLPIFVYNTPVLPYAGP